jgi:glycerol-3-phosphate dehydrogenase (NAD(P)+)
MKKVCVLGAGSWGTAQAILLNKNLYDITIWGRPEDNIDDLKITRENKRFLPGVRIPDNIEITTDMVKAVTRASFIVLAVPSQAMRSVVEKLSKLINKDTYLINTAKGLEIETRMRMSQVVEDILGKEIKPRYAVLSGPSHAEEVAREVPTVVTVAAFCKDTAFYVQDLYMSPVFRVYTNPDVAGVELGGALKNILALTTGMADGLGYGDNTQAALITRGLAELIRLGEAMGGDPRTFSGLSGIGDLLVTCGSRHSRNRRAGFLIGQGYSLDDTLTEIGMVVEGVHTTRAIHRVSSEMNIEMPITNACYNILYKNESAKKAVNLLMQRRKKHEIEEIVNNIHDW